MKLNKKISIITITIVFLSLLGSSVVNIISFRKNYTEALLTGSYGLGYTLNNVISELLDLGLPLTSLDGMDKKVRQLVEQNPHISYVGIVDLTGTVLFHSDLKLSGKLFTDVFMQNSIAAIEPLTQIYQRFDGHSYYDVTLPVFNTGRSHVAALRLGFRTDLINAKVMEAVIQVVINFSLCFLIIAFGINQLLFRFISLPVMGLAQHAKRIASGQYNVLAPYHQRNDEIGVLSDAFDQLSDTIKRQITELQDSNDKLDALVMERTYELAQANDELLNKNTTLEHTVSQLLHSEITVKESEAKFRSLFESSSDAVMHT